MNPFDFAMKMEFDGKAYYETLALDTPVAGLKTIFTMLAQDEQKHYDAIHAIKMGAEETMSDTIVLNEAKNVFGDLMAEKNALTPLKKDLEAYRHAMKIEADSVKLYEEFAKKESNSETAQLFLKIANEEKKHFNILENIHDFVMSPQNYLAWGEFSNLKEF